MASDEQLKEIFKEWDKDGSGRVDTTELKAIIEKIQERFPDKLATEELKKKQLDFLLQKFDLNADGTVTLDEFIGAYKGSV